MSVIRQLIIIAIFTLFIPGNVILAETTNTTSENILPPTINLLPCLTTTEGINFTDKRGGGIGKMYDKIEKNLSSYVFSSHPQDRLIKGVGNNMFGNLKPLSRFEMTKIALGSNCIDWQDTPTPNTYFTDVPTDNSEMSLVIGKAHNLNIISGIGNHFFPQKTVTHGEFLKILFHSSNYFEMGLAKQPLSTKVSNVTEPAFQQAVEHALRINMISASNFHQNDTVMRYQMAEMLNRYIIFMQQIIQCSQELCEPYYV